MLKARKSVLGALLAIAIAVGAVGAIVLPTGTAHAAAALPRVAAAQCYQTYWSYDDAVGTTSASFSTGTVYFDIHLDVLRDAYTGYYCGQYRTHSCALVPYRLDPSHTYRLLSDTYLNSHYISRYQIGWTANNPGYEVDMCTPSTPASGGARGGDVGVNATVYSPDANRWGSPYFDFYLY